MHTYGTEFSLSSAQNVLPIIFDAIGTPDSVVDVGCGIGTWLSVCDDLGVARITGVDGPHVISTGQLLIPDSNFIPVNLEGNAVNISAKTKYDLVISLEVAEHLSERSADNYVGLLTSLSEIILFSAAIPGQTGMNHVNEQYPEYWQEKFKTRGFEFFDIRGAFWNNSDIEWWYRQNMFLIVRVGSFPYLENYFKKWQGDFFISREMLEQYTKSLNSVNSENLSKSIILRAVKIFPRYILNYLRSSFSTGRW